MTKDEYNNFIKLLKSKSATRLFNLKRKYKNLLYTCHDKGAGGIVDSEEYIMYNDIVNRIDKILSEKK